MAKIDESVSSGPGFKVYPSTDVQRRRKKMQRAQVELLPMIVDMLEELSKPKSNSRSLKSAKPDPRIAKMKGLAHTLKRRGRD